MIGTAQPDEQGIMMMMMIMIRIQCDQKTRESYAYIGKSDTVLSALKANPVLCLFALLPEH